MMTSKNPFLSALKEEITASRKEAPKGMRRCSPREKGIHYAPSDSLQNARMVCFKPTDTAEGHAAWEASSRETHERIEREGDAILVLVMQGHPIGMKSHRDRLQAWREGKLELPTLAAFLGMKSDKPNANVPRAEVHRRETTPELEARLARQREEKRTGIRLERPGIIRVER